jgi:hypothetical protein
MPHRIKTELGYISGYLYSSKNHYCDFRLEQDKNKAHVFKRVADAARAVHRIGIHSPWSQLPQLKYVQVETYFPDIEAVMGS